MSLRARSSTRMFALSPAEWATTGMAAAVSSAAYVWAGHPYLARGVIGDLLGFFVLGLTASVVRRRLRHEALICLTFIGLVLLIDPQWPLRLAEPVWWALFAGGLVAYLAVRRRICD